MPLRAKGLFACLLMSASLAVQAQEALQPQPATPVADSVSAAAGGDPPVTDMDAVAVSGVQPGPGMWRVSRDGHTLWILGTLSPLPKRMQWRPDEVEAVIASAQEVIAPPTWTLSTGQGLFRSLLLVPSLLKARKNPDGKTLQDVLPPQQYARWQVLKARYLGRDGGVEKWRPIFAAQELYEAAMRKSGLSLDSVVQPRVAKAAKRHSVPVTATKVELTVDNPKAAIKEFQTITLADGECFSKTLTRIESDLDAMRARANAWAVGDIEALRSIPSGNQYSACIAAATETGLARKLGISDLPRRGLDAWQKAAEQALSKNAVTFSTLPMGVLLEPGGMMDRLQAKGYTVEAPP